MGEGAVRRPTEAGAEQQQQQQGGLGAGSPLLAPHTPHPSSPPLSFPFLLSQGSVHFFDSQSLSLSASDCSPLTLCPCFSLCFCPMPSSLLCPMSLSVPISQLGPLICLSSPLPGIFSVYPSALLCSSLPLGSHLPHLYPPPCFFPQYLSSPPTSAHLPHFCQSPSTSVHLPPPVSLHLYPPLLPLSISPLLCISLLCSAHHDTALPFPYLAPQVYAQLGSRLAAALSSRPGAPHACGQILQGTEKRVLDTHTPVPSSPAP